MFKVYKHTPRASEHKTLSRIFGPKKVEKAEEWRRLHNEEIYDLCPS
jgi:hypothetical protein